MTNKLHRFLDFLSALFSPRLVFLRGQKRNMAAKQLLQLLYSPDHVVIYYLLMLLGHESWELGVAEGQW